MIVPNQVCLLLLMSLTGISANPYLTNEEHGENSLNLRDADFRNFIGSTWNRAKNDFNKVESSIENAVYGRPAIPTENGPKHKEAFAYEPAEELKHFTQRPANPGAPSGVQQPSNLQARGYVGNLWGKAKNEYQKVESNIKQAVNGNPQRPKIAVSSNKEAFAYQEADDLHRVSHNARVQARDLHAMWQQAKSGANKMASNVRQSIQGHSSPPAAPVPAHPILAANPGKPLFNLQPLSSGTQKSSDIPRLNPGQRAFLAASGANPNGVKTQAVVYAQADDLERRSLHDDYDLNTLISRSEIEELIRRTNQRRAPGGKGANPPATQGPPPRSGGGGKPFRKPSGGSGKKASAFAYQMAERLERRDSPRIARPPPPHKTRGQGKAGRPRLPPPLRPSAMAFQPAESLERRSGSSSSSNGYLRRRNGLAMKGDSSRILTGRTGTNGASNAITMTTTRRPVGRQASILNGQAKPMSGQRIIPSWAQSLHRGDIAFAKSPASRKASTAHNAMKELYWRSTNTKASKKSAGGGGGGRRLRQGKQPLSRSKYRTKSRLGEAFAFQQASDLL